MQYDKDLQSEHKDLFLAARTVLLEIPGVVETRKERITTYSFGDAGLCHLRTVKDGIDIGFLRGTLLNDSFNLLIGTGKAIRVLHLKELNKEILAHYLTQAMALNRKR